MWGFLIYNFIYLWLCWVFVGARRLSLVTESGGYSLLQALEHADFSRCGTQAQLLSSMWNLPGPGIKPMSSALADRILSIAPPGKSQVTFFVLFLFSCACGIQFPDQGSNLGAQSLNHWTTREAPQVRCFFFFSYNFLKK